jgi:hypothetical protein
MFQAKFSIREEQAAFIDNFRSYGFKDKSSMIRDAIDLLKEDRERHLLQQSADLYAEQYLEDPELKDLTRSAIQGWPG